MVVIDELPFRFVGGLGFRSFCAVIQPKFVIPSRMTIARDVVHLYNSEMEKLKKELTKDDQRVCLTTDCWTSNQQIPYLCLTVHYIDSDWCLKKRILNFVQISNHKGETIAKLIEDCLHKWGIERVFTITMDNATANDVAVSILKRRVNGWEGSVLNGEYMHVRCCAHILNLIVSDGLKELHHSISAIRAAVRYIRLSTARVEKLSACVVKEKIDFKGKLVLDVPTRWNSTYKMLEVALKCQKAFERYEEEDSKYLQYFLEEEGGKKKFGPPSKIDWANASRFVEFLRSFYQATLKFSATKSVTSNCFYLELGEIFNLLKNLALTNDSLLLDMVSNMKKKFDKYWGNLDNTNLLLYVAAVLDPRYKLGYITYCLGCFYDAQTVSNFILKVQTLLRTLYAFYSKGEREISPIPKSFTSPNTLQRQDTLLSAFMKQKEQITFDESLNEVDRYLADESVNPLTPSFETLFWWKQNSIKYPVLSLIARDVLAVPISTVASESAFSTGGRILDPYRSSLNPKTVNMLVCTQNWLKSTNEGLVEQFFSDEDDELVQIGLIL
ncbi:hypothetical protein UlMin_029300 [Ulmus minor]